MPGVWSGDAELPRSHRYRCAVIESRQIEPPAGPLCSPGSWRWAGGIARNRPPNHIQLPLYNH